MKRRLGKNDKIFFLVIFLILILICCWFYFFKPEGGKSILITIDGKNFGTYSLAKEQQIEIPDQEGNVTNIVLISEGKAKMIQANCPDKLCMNQNAVSRNNENIVCLPNKVVVTAIAEESDEIDAFAK